MRLDFVYIGLRLPLRKRLRLIASGRVPLVDAAVRVAVRLGLRYGAARPVFTLLAGFQQPTVQQRASIVVA